MHEGAFAQLILDPVGRAAATSQGTPEVATGLSASCMSDKLAWSETSWFDTTDQIARRGHGRVFPAALPGRFACPTCIQNMLVSFDRKRPAWHAASCRTPPADEFSLRHERSGNQ